MPLRAARAGRMLARPPTGSATAEEPMPVSRRRFVRSLSLGGAAALGAPLVLARGHEAMAAALDDASPHAIAGAPSPIRLNSNENPHGPSAASMRAVERALRGDASRYPRGPEGALADAVAAAHGVKVEQVLLGAGSGEILRTAVFAFTGPAKALVTAAPSFEDPVRHADLLGTPVRAVPVDAGLGLDLDAMAAQCAGAGLVFLCNPNNPTGTVHPASAVRDFVAAVRRRAPEAYVLVDEAYHEFAEDPGYASALPLALEDARVVVTRTFSKVYGLAGLRVGYAVGAAPTIALMRRQRLGNSVNALGAAAALAVLGDPAFAAEQVRLNREAREWARGELARAGFASRPSHANFVMVDIGRDARAFQQACQARGVLVGRPFPPLATHARISVGTMDEMRAAMPIIGGVLAS